jgi:hypothetical protein
VLGREAIYGGSDIVIIARTDALASEGFDGALERASCISCPSKTSLMPSSWRLASAVQTWLS